MYAGAKLINALMSYIKPLFPRRAGRRSEKLGVNLSPPHLIVIELTLIGMSSENKKNVHLVPPRSNFYKTQ